MNMTHIKLWGISGRGLLLVLGLLAGAARADGDLPSAFTNQGSIANTRHNMTQRQPGSTSPDGALMDRYRNDYAEVCVYCHTPHGANSNVALPLWNRTIKATTYTTYDALGTSSLTQPVSQPGPNSLSCLSCHDGQVAVDSVINMPNQPGAQNYLASQATSQSNAFLNSWTNPRGVDATAHMGLDPVPANGCLSCHSSGVGAVGDGATDFSAFVIGTDLRNDHPIGVRFPAAGPSVDFNQPGATKTGMRWFDGNGNGRPDSREVRLYDSGEGFEVECASCHDPHGVPAGGVGSAFNPTFLRVPNTGSALCLTCHTK
jgi:mono/diheme cytochrome c family protein